MQKHATLLWGVMSERFLKFFPSRESLYLARKHPNAFILLVFIAHRARRTHDDPDGYTIGQCHIGDHNDFGLTEKEYRTAKRVLVERELIKIVETCRTRKSNSGQDSDKNFKNHEKSATERATRTTTYGTLVELCDSTVWDINPESENQREGDRKGDRRATEGRRSRRNKKEEEGKRRRTYCSVGCAASHKRFFVFRFRVMGIRWNHGTGCCRLEGHVLAYRPPDRED